MSFTTSSLPLAAYLIAGGSLEFLEIELTTPNKAIFVFRDLQQRGAELERQFWKGAHVSAVGFHTQLRLLRRAVDDKTSAARSGVAGPTQFKGKNSNVRITNSIR